MSKILLTKEQSLAEDLLMKSLFSRDRKDTVLVGYAGTGKTTLIDHLIERLRKRNVDVILLVPTGKAGVNLKARTGRQVSTIHSAIYGAPELDKKTGELKFSSPKGGYCKSGDVVIVDEASMIGLRVYKDLKRATNIGARLLFVGDSFQLPPVNDSVGPDLKRPTAKLETVHRQEIGSYVLKYATSIRSYSESDFYKTYDFSDTTLRTHKEERALEWMIFNYENGIDHTMLCFTNKLRTKLNREIRDHLGFGGEVLAVGDKIVVRANNHNVGLCNGEVLTVKNFRIDIWRGEVFYDVKFEETAVRCKILRSLFGASSSDFWEWKKASRIYKNNNWINVDYGYALTVHSSQGSQWDRVGFVWDAAYENYRRRNKVSAQRLFYTAITRTCDRFALFGG